MTAHDHRHPVVGCFRCDLSSAEALLIPPPDCIIGYSRDAVEQILAENFTAFAAWMRGQTAAICDGRSYDYETQQYRQTDCGPHGAVIYAHDLVRFMEGGPIVD